MSERGALSLREPDPPDRFSPSASALYPRKGFAAFCQLATSENRRSRGSLPLSLADNFARDLGQPGVIRRCRYARLGQ